MIRAGQLDPHTKDVLEGFADIIYAGVARVQELSDRDLEAFLMAGTRVTGEHCDWRLYAVALKSLWLYEAAVHEFVRRNEPAPPAAPALKAVVH